MLRSFKECSPQINAAPEQAPHLKSKNANNTMALN